MSIELGSKKVMVTGGAGFLGSYVVEQLKKKGCQNIFVPTIEQYDLTKKEAIDQAFTDAEPDIVIHLAAKVGGIGANRDNPGSFFYDNLMMGTQLMDESRLRGVEKFVALGTICCYPKHANVPFKESDLWDGYPEEVTAPYGMAKKMQLVQAKAYRQQYGFNSIFIMPTNLYGPRDNFNPNSSHVVAALIKKFVEAVDGLENEVEVWGTGKSTRDFLYVEDCAQAIVMAVERYDSPEPINFGSGKEVYIKDLAQLIAELSGFNGKIVWDVLKPEGQPRRVVDSSLAKEEIGFSPNVELRVGLKKTIDFYRKQMLIISPNKIK